MRFLLVLALVACGQGAVDLPLGSSGSAVFSCPAQLSGDQLTAQNPVVTGDTLSFTVSHSGGCKEPHLYGVCWDGTLLESQPPQASLKVLHDDQGDSCEAVRTRSLQIDLTTLKARLQRDHQLQSGTVILRLSSTQPNPRYDF